MPRRPPPKACELCEREAPLSFHHLIPRKNHRKRRFQKHFSKEEMQERGLYLCRLCHKQLHRLYSERELGEALNTKEALLADPEIEKFLVWARKQR